MILTPQHIENRKTWIADLRSGNRKQERLALARLLVDGTVGYCCLGVAADDAGCSMDKMESPKGGITFDGIFGVLPARAREWLGVRSEDPCINFPHGLVTQNDRGKPTTLDIRSIVVAQLNDQGFTFPQIADLVERFGFTDDERP